MPVVEDFSRSRSWSRVRVIEAPVVQDQELDARQHLEEAAVASITAGEQQGIK